MKIRRLFKIVFYILKVFLSYKLQDTVTSFLFLVVLHQFLHQQISILGTSFYIFIQHFLKRYFRQKFFSFNGFTHPNIPLTAKVRKAWQKIFVDNVSTGPNLEKNSTRRPDPANFYENYRKLYSDGKHLKTSLNWGW